MDTKITAAELALLQASDKAVTLLDVRRKEDFAKEPTTYGGASWKNPAEVDEWASSLPERQQVIIYCVRGGSVSQSLQQRLAEKGCAVRYVEGGLEALNKNSQGR